MLKSRHRCYEIESCYIALAVSRAATLSPSPTAPPRTWWRRLMGRLTGKRAAAAALLVVALVSPAAGADTVISAKTFLDAATEGPIGQTLRTYYVSGAVDGLAVLGMQCPVTTRYGEIIAWTDAEIYKAAARNSADHVLIFVLKGLAEHGCRRP